MPPHRENICICSIFPVEASLKAGWINPSEHQNPNRPGLSKAKQATCTQGKHFGFIPLAGPAEPWVRGADRRGSQDPALPPQAPPELQSLTTAKATSFPQPPAPWDEAQRREQSIPWQRPRSSSPGSPSLGGCSLPCTAPGAAQQEQAVVWNGALPSQPAQPLLGVASA